MSAPMTNGHAPVALAERLEDLLPHHAQLLEASAISEEAARARGYRSGLDAAELEALGFAPDQRRAPGLLIPVYDARGEVAYHQLRPDDPRELSGKRLKYETASKKWRARRGLRSRGVVVDVPPPARDTLADASTPLWITEGTRKADAAVSLGLCCVALIGVWGFRTPKDEDPAQKPLPDWAHFALEGRRVYVCFDSDVMVKSSVREALAALKAFLDDQGADVRLVYLPAGDGGAKVGFDDFLAGGGTRDDLLELATRELREPNAGGKDASQATRLIGVVDAAGVELFHTPSGETWATFPVEGHRETHPTGSRAFRRWLARAFRQNGSTVGSQALQDALVELEGRAAYDGPEQDVHTRIAEHDGALYVDLADSQWQVVEIRPGGWRTVAESPVKFRRKGGTLPLPAPVAGGAIDELRQFVNVADDDDWTLIVGWLVGALAPRGPYAMLALHGEQGSAKSTTARFLRALIDPQSPELSRPPRKDHDLMVSAKNGWLLAYDNLSDIPTSLSDALCVVLSGGGFSTRQLFTDDEEARFDAQRPVLITGIEELATRSDLLDRSILLTLPRREVVGAVRTERTLLADFEAVRPRILGALFEAVATALGRAEAVRRELEEAGGLPRLADFGAWVSAAESGLGWPPGRFLATYAGNRAAGNDVALEASPIGLAVRGLVEATGRFEGQAADLLTRLEETSGEATVRQKVWPKNARALGAELRRLAPNLRASGIDVEEPVRQAGTGKRIWTLVPRPEICVTTVTTVTEPPTPPLASDVGCDANAGGRDANEPGVTQGGAPCDGAVTQVVLTESTAGKPNRDGRDGCDANLGPSGAGQRQPSVPERATPEQEAEAERLLRKLGDPKS